MSSPRYHHPVLVPPAFQACHQQQGDSNNNNGGGSVGLDRTSANLESMSFWINGVLTLALIVLGITGNLIMLVSLGCKTKRWLPLYFYFANFAFWNSTLLLSTVGLYALSALHTNNVRYYESSTLAYFNIAAYPIANSGMTASVWLVLCLTVERALVVSRPLDRFVSETKRRAKLVTLAISVLAPVYSLPLFFELKVEPVEDNEDSRIWMLNSTMDTPLYDVVKTGLRDNTAYKIIYRIVFNLLFLSLVPFVIVVALSARIMFVIRKRVEEGDRCPPIWCPPEKSPRSLAPPRTHRSHRSASNFSSSKIDQSESSNTSLSSLNVDKSRHLVVSRSERQTTNSLRTIGDHQHPSTLDPNGNTRKDDSSHGRCHWRPPCDHSQRTHVTLTVLAAKYVICYTLPTVLNFFELIFEPKSLREMGVGVLVDLSDLMVVADGALNAFVYFSWRRKIQLRGLSFRSKTKATVQRQIVQKTPPISHDESNRRRSTFL